VLDMRGGEKGLILRREKSEEPFVPEPGEGGLSLVVAARKRKLQIQEGQTTLHPSKKQESSRGVSNFLYLLLPSKKRRILTLSLHDQFLSNVSSLQGGERVPFFRGGETA